MVWGAVDICMSFPYIFLAAKKAVFKKNTEKGVFTMTYQDINRRFSEIVSDYLQKGYYCNTSTMEGSQGEQAKVDLTNGKEIIRVLSKAFREEYAKQMELSGIKILVGRAPNDITPNHSCGGTIWNNDLQILCEEKFYKISQNSRAFYGTMEESAAAYALHFTRCFKKQAENKITLPDAAKSIALRWVRKQPKLKSSKLRDISEVCILYRAGMKEYWIFVKDRCLCIHRRTLYKKGE